MSSLLKSLTLEQKVGQLFVYNYRPKFYQQDNPSFRKVLKAVEKYHIAGVSLASGETYAVARTINKLQEKARIPLLVMAFIIPVVFLNEVAQRRSVGFIQRFARGLAAKEVERPVISRKGVKKTQEETPAEPAKEDLDY